MIWKDHSNLEGKHSFLSPSSPHWMNYTDEQLVTRYCNSYSQTVGTTLHALAKDLIDEKFQLAKSDKKMVSFELIRKGVPRWAFDMDFMYSNLMAYVNDAIGLRMSPEIVLYHSDICFGTADAIKYDNGKLRIHDLKTGTTPAHIEQLMCYAALFCLEYKDILGLDLNKMEFELRIYQYDQSTICNPSPMEVRKFVDEIVHKNNVLKNYN